MARNSILPTRRMQGSSDRSSTSSQGPSTVGVPWWGVVAIGIALTTLVAIEIVERTESERSHETSHGAGVLSAHGHADTDAEIAELHASQTDTVETLAKQADAITRLEARVKELALAVKSRKDDDDAPNAAAQGEQGLPQPPPPPAPPPPPQVSDTANTQDKLSSDGFPDVCSSPAPAEDTPFVLAEGRSDDYTCKSAKATPVSMHGLQSRMADRAGWEFPIDSLMSGNLDGVKPGDFSKMKNGDTVFITSHELRVLALELQRRNLRVDLITGGDDEGTPLQLVRRSHGTLDWEGLLRDHVRVWFAQNYDLNYSHPKIVPIPIGINVREPGPAVCEHVLGMERIRAAAKPFAERKTLAVMTWMSITSRDRMTAQKVLRGAEGVVELEQMDRTELYERMAEYKFVISPVGGGFDTYRTWEALVLGCIPIIRRNPLSSTLLAGLPVITVEEWTDVTPDNLRKWADAQVGEVPTSTYSLDAWTRYMERQRRAIVCG